MLLLAEGIAELVLAWQQGRTQIDRDQLIDICADYLLKPPTWRTRPPWP